MDNSKIEWTDHTFNPWWGCMKVSEGCKHCYAEALDNRWKGSHWGPNGNRKPMSAEYWRKPLKWNDAAAKAGKPAKVFCASMADVFEGHPDTLLHLVRLFTIIHSTSNLIWQLLTKRPENIMRLVPEPWKTSWPSNVWIGTSVENQAAADERIIHLLSVPAPVRFLSCEPILGRVDLWYPKSIWPEGPKTCCSGKDCGCMGLPVDPPLISGIDWVIAGGESGHHARPMHPDWVRSLRDQCAAADVPFFFKQWGQYIPTYHAGERCYEKSRYGNSIGECWVKWDHRFDDGTGMIKVGKKAAGRLLDGKEYSQFPQTLNARL